MSTALRPEQWRPIPGFPGYDVSDQGRVRSWHTWRGRPGPRLLKRPRMSVKGYHYVNLYDPAGRHRTIRVYRLVTLAFRGPKPPGMVTRHIDGNAGNDRLANVVYGTALENSADQREHGTHSNTVKTACPQGHAYTDENTYTDPKGSRHCRICERARKREQYRRKTA